MKSFTEDLLIPIHGPKNRTCLINKTPIGTVRLDQIPVNWIGDNEINLIFLDRLKWRRFGMFWGDRNEIVNLIGCNCKYEKRWEMDTHNRSVRVGKGFCLGLGDDMMKFGSCVLFIFVKYVWENREMMAMVISSITF